MARKPAGSGVYLTWIEYRAYLPAYGETVYALWSNEISEDTVNAARAYVERHRAYYTNMLVDVRD